MFKYLITFFSFFLFIVVAQPVFSASSKTAGSYMRYSHGWDRLSLGDEHYVDSAKVDLVFTANTASDVELNGMTVGQTVQVTKNMEITYSNQGAYWDTPLGCFCDDYATGCTDCKTFDDKEPINGTHSDYWMHYHSDYALGDPNLVGRSTWTASPIPSTSIAGDGTIISCNNSTWVCSAVGVGTNGKITVSFGTANMRFDNQVYARTCPLNDSDCPDNYEGSETDWDMGFVWNGTGFHSSHPPTKSGCSFGYHDYKGICGKPYFSFRLNGAAATTTVLSNSTFTFPARTIQFTIEGKAAPVAGVCGSAAGTATTYPPASNRCTTGASSAVSACPNSSGNYTWTCASTGGLADTSCSAPYSVTDSKVRYYDGGVKKIAAAVGSGSVLKVRNAGNTVDLATWPTNTTCTSLISKIKVKTPAGIRYLGIIP